VFSLKFFSRVLTINFGHRRSSKSSFSVTLSIAKEVHVSMPLIIFSGLPSSGKTTRALQLQKALEAKVSTSLRKFKVHVINDDTLGINREVYRGVSTKRPSNL
jgi:DNA polymerase III delta prime subunit